MQTPSPTKSKYPAPIPGRAVPWQPSYARKPKISTGDPSQAKPSHRNPQLSPLIFTVTPVSFTGTMYTITVYEGQQSIWCSWEDPCVGLRWLHVRGVALPCARPFCCVHLGTLHIGSNASSMHMQDRDKFFSFCWSERSEWEKQTFFSDPSNPHPHT